MQYILSSCVGWVYLYIIKPYIFKFIPPDEAHHMLVKYGSKFQHWYLFRLFAKYALRYENLPYLAQSIHGLNFKNPVGISAGFDKNFEVPRMLQSFGFGFLEIGSMTYGRYDGNPKPWFKRLPKTKSLTVWAGLANHGIKVIIPRIVNTKIKLPLNISIAKTNCESTNTFETGAEDYTKSLQYLKESGQGSFVTLNISCPNTYGGEPFTTPEALELLLTKTDGVKYDKPIYLKMPVEATEKEWDNLLDVILRHNIQGVILSNLAKNRENIDLKDELPDEVKGGLSGKPCFELSNELIKRTYRKCGDKLIIIGCGGIFSAEDAYTKIRNGATLIELLTGMIFVGPQLMGDINRKLVKFLKRDGYRNISEVIGIDAYK